MVELDRTAAATVHYANDPRIRLLAQARWRMTTDGTEMDWLSLGKNNPDALIAEARDWVRAAVAASILLAPGRAAKAETPEATTSPALNPLIDALCDDQGAPTGADAYAAACELLATHTRWLATKQRTHLNTQGYDATCVCEGCTSCIAQDYIALLDSHADRLEESAQQGSTPTLTADEHSAGAPQPPADEPRPFEELRDTGLLWFINRLAFHPRGLALALHIDDAGAAHGWSLLPSSDGLWTFDSATEAEGQARAVATLTAAADTPH